MVEVIHGGNAGPGDSGQHVVKVRFLFGRSCWERGCHSIVVDSLAINTINSQHSTHLEPVSHV